MTSRSPEARDLTAGCSPQLYTNGEEGWPTATKVHLGCGGIYLDGYVNIDITGETLPLVAPEGWGPGVIWDYYGGLAGTHAHLPTRRPTYADRVGDFQVNYSRWGFATESIKKLVMIQTFEHLSPKEGIDLLILLHRLLVPGGVLILSVPDMTDTLDWLEWADRETIEGAEKFHFALRHLRGSRRDAYNHHKAWYTEETLFELVQAAWFSPCMLDNFHVYPALVLQAIKS